MGVSSSLSKTPKEEAVVLMQFDTDPEMQSRLMQIIHNEILTIVKDGPLAEDLQKVKENLLKQHEQDLEQNSWWSSVLRAYYENGINYISDYKTSVNAITAASVQKMLKEIVDQGNVIEVVMMPEE